MKQFVQIKTTPIFILFLLTLFFCTGSSVFGQRSNYNEQDVVMMRSQQNVGASIMRLLEAKNTDSALFYFKDKGVATKKKLKKIATAIQAVKGKYDFSSSPDAPDDDVNHIICKYTSNEGVDTHYKVVFVFARYDKTYKASSILFK